MKCTIRPRITSTIMPDTMEYFKEELVIAKLEIPNQKPNMERVLRLVANAEVEDANLIETEVGLSNEGQNLSGYKLVVELKISQKLLYVADEPTQSVHAAEQTTMKSIFIIVPKEINGEDVCSLFRAGKIQVNPYIEAVKTRMLNCREVYNCILLVVDAEIC